MTFWYESGSGSADPFLCLMEPDPHPDPAIFVIDLQDANKKLIKKKFICLLLFERTFASFFEDKKSKRSHETVRIKVFLIILFDNRWMIEGSRTRNHTSDLLIRIRNTANNNDNKKVLHHRFINTSTNKSISKKSF
jgi:hypothetical protein